MDISILHIAFWISGVFSYGIWIGWVREYRRRNLWDNESKLLEEGDTRTYTEYLLEDDPTLEQLEVRRQIKETRKDPQGRDGDL